MASQGEEIPATPFLIRRNQTRDRFSSLSTAFHSPLVREAAGKAAARLGEAVGVREIDAAAFDAEVVRSPVPVLVLFWHRLGGPERMMRRLVGRLAGAASGLRFLAVDLHDEGNWELAAAHRLNATPTCLFFRGGQEVGRLVGVHDEERLREVLGGLAAG